jgi:proteasome lid subunit RPN8/RPN11
MIDTEFLEEAPAHQTRRVESMEDMLSRMAFVNTGFLKILDMARAYGERNKEEETGGIILYREKDKKYLWQGLPNKHAGTPTARGLYQPVDEIYAAKIVALFPLGWRLHASFHTHPTFPVNPSHTDLTLLFQNFNKNIIYSLSDNEIAIYIWVNETQYKKNLIKL